MLRSRAAVIASALVVAAGVAGTAGCAARAAAAPQPPAIQASTAYVPLPVSAGITTAYLALRNDGSADSLVSASTSLGGTVIFREPGAGSGMRSVPAIAIPAHAMLRLVPDGPHLVISGARRMQGGKEFTLTLDFRHAGRLRVAAVVTNPQSGNSSTYLFN